MPPQLLLIHNERSRIACTRKVKDIFLLANRQRTAWLRITYRNSRETEKVYIRVSVYFTFLSFCLPFCSGNVASVAYYIRSIESSWIILIYLLFNTRTNITASCLLSIRGRSNLLALFFYCTIPLLRPFTYDPVPHYCNYRQRIQSTLCIYSTEQRQYEQESCKLSSTRFPSNLSLLEIKFYSLKVLDASAPSPLSSCLGFNKSFSRFSSSPRKCRKLAWKIKVLDNSSKVFHQKPVVILCLVKFP